MSLLKAIYMCQVRYMLNIGWSCRNCFSEKISNVMSRVLLVYKVATRPLKYWIIGELIIDNGLLPFSNWYKTGFWQVFVFFEIYSAFGYLPNLNISDNQRFFNISKKDYLSEYKMQFSNHNFFCHSWEDLSLFCVFCVCGLCGPRWFAGVGKLL